MKLLAVFVAGMLMMVQCPLTLAQQPTQQVTQPATGQSQWGALEAVPAGTDMVIETRTGETIKGKLVSISASTLTLSRNNKTTSIELPQVQKVYRLVGRTRKKSAAVGAAAGGTAGLGLGLAVYLPDRNDIVGAIVPAFAIIGTGIGAGIGALTGSARKKILIYEAK